MTPNPNPSPELRTRMFLEILSAMGGRSDASEGAYCWTNAFCETHEGHEPDTFNRAIDAGYVAFSHDSDTDCSTISITPAGRAALSPQTLPAPGEVRVEVCPSCEGSGIGAVSAICWTCDGAGTSSTLATVAAANDEGVARIVLPPMPDCDDRQPWEEGSSYNESNNDWCRRNTGAVTWLIDNHAAIRLLSQGGGKARSEGWTEKGHEWLDAGASLATSRSQHEGASS
jgi:hypothetical protein